jgi:hypothetical protein
MPAKRKATRKKRAAKVAHLTVDAEVNVALGVIGRMWADIRAITERESGRLGK